MSRSGGRHPWQALQPEGCALRLPYDRDPVGASRFTRSRWNLPLSTDFVSHARSTGPFFPVLMSALDVVVTRYCGEPEIPVVTFIRGRSGSGACVNPLVVLVQVHGDDTMARLIARTKRALEVAVQHGDVPYEEAVGSRSPSLSGRGRYSQVVLTLIGAEISDGGGALDAEDIQAVRSRVVLSDLAFMVTAAQEGLSVTIDYDAELFERATIERIGSEFEMVFRAGLTTPDARVRDLPNTTEEELRRVTGELNSTTRALPDDATIPRLFSEQVARVPDTVALVAGDVHLSYRVLNERANQLAHHLIRSGVRPEEPVAVCVRRSIDSVTSVLGILKAGATYVPLNPSDPRSRLDMQLRDCGIRLLVTRSADRIPGLGVESVRLEDDGARIGDCPTTDPRIVAHGLAAAYVLHTSGSTGRPKGIVGTHVGVINRAMWMWRCFPFEAEEVVCHKTPLGFVDSAWEMFGGLLAGTRTALVPDDIVPDSRRFARLLHREGVSRLVLVPSHLSALLDTLGDLGRAVPSLSTLTTSGEELTLDTSSRFREGAPRATLINLYGSTECSGDSTFFCIEPDAVEPEPRIGRPIDNTTAVVVDCFGAPLPSGAPGELILGGVGVARGYVGQPGLTASRFLPDAFSASPGCRAYRTGDAARIHSSGAIEFIGRIDRQVKIRGVRIELEEIERALCMHDAVEQAVALSRGDDPDAARLEAFVVVRSGCEVTPSEMVSFVARRLPAPMVPALIAAIDELPKTPSGKIDRVSLEARKPLDGDRVDPRLSTPISEVIAEIWRETLGMSAIRSADDYFELGGHSLMAARIAARIEDVFGVELTLGQFLELRTIDAVSAAVEDGLAAGPRVELPCVDPKAETRELSLEQRQMWILDQLQPGDPTYNVFLAHRVSGPLDLRGLERALFMLHRRHPLLRTTVRVTDGIPRLDINEDAPEPELSVISVDGRRFSMDVALGVVSEVVHRPFALEHDPVARVFAVRVGPRDHLLGYSVHHLFSDMWSLQILARDLGALYSEAVGAGDRGLPGGLLRYSAYSAWQRHAIDSGGFDGRLAFWKDRLADAPRAIQFGRRREAGPGDTRGAQCSTELGARQAEPIKALAKRAGVTDFVALMAGFVCLMKHVAREDRVVIGTDIAGRDRPEVENVFGYFVQQLALEFDLGAVASFRELLGHVRKVFLDAYANRVPVAKVVAEVGGAREHARTPLFNVLFAMYVAPRGKAEFAQCSTEPVDIEFTTSPFDLSFYVSPTAEGGYRVLARYRLELLTVPEVETLLDKYVRLVVAAASRADEECESLIGSLQERSPPVVSGPPPSRFRLDRLMNIRPQPVFVSGAVRCDHFDGTKLPRVVRGATDGMDLISWLRENPSFLDEELDAYGAVLFRGFGLSTVQEFRELAGAAFDRLMPYEERSSPRKAVDDQVYTSTEHPADQLIPLHTEHSYTTDWPMRIAFFCGVPASEGGATPVGDTRQVLASLRPETVAKFELEQVMYVRNYGRGLGLSWEEAFQTRDRTTMEEYCRMAAIDVEWRSDGVLRTRQVRPAVRVHPRTGDRVWFNHGCFFNVRALDAATAQALMAAYGPMDLPLNTFYGNGEPIEPEVIDEIGRAYRSAEVRFPWERGDVLVLDNMLVAHGRDAYVGDREVFVVMAEPVSSGPSTGS